MKGLRILLLQARDRDDPMAQHERNCFVEHMELPDDRIDSHNLIVGPPSLKKIKDYDALTVGGSGNYDVSKGNLPDFERCLDFLREIVEFGKPMYASCFGYQCMVKALGGEIIQDSLNTEVGTFELALTEAGRTDELYKNLPAKFLGQLGHKDRASSHPDGIPNLVSSQRSPFQAMRIPNKPIWASQFHPELSREKNLDRYKHYLNVYTGHLSESEMKETYNRFRESKEASALLRRFLDLVFK